MTKNIIKKDKQITPEYYFMFGIHAVKAALVNPKRKKYELWVSENAKQKIVQNGLMPIIPVYSIEKSKNLPIPKDNVHQGAILKVSPLQQALNINSFDKSSGPEVVVLLDKVTDPQNVGAIVRSSFFFGCKAVINTRHGAPKENGSLVKAACGAFEYIPYIQVSNMAQIIRKLKSSGFVIIGLDEKSSKPLSSISSSKENTAVVFGAEGKGLRRLTRDLCDQTVAIDGNNNFSSLNVSTAVGISLFSIKKNIT